MWFVNVFSTFRREKKLVKNWHLIGGPLVAGGGAHTMYNWHNG